MRYRLSTTAQARNELRNLPGHVRQIAVRMVNGLTEDPRPPEARELREKPGRYRIRLQKWRLIYRVYDEDGTVVLLRVRLKTGPESYEDLE
jgi:mRNA-degrading endonuclease RelE of RelBE toxin-antitoxin system